MATVDIQLATVMGRSAQGGSLPVMDSTIVDSDLITSSATSQQSDYTVPTNSIGLVWWITVTGGPVRIKFGSNPTAANAEGGGWLILAETALGFMATPGDKIAVIDA